MIGFRKSHAVVIGIDEYGHGIPSLRTAVHDASRVAQVLEKEYGYSVRVLTENVSLANLRAVFEESLPKVIEADDRLLVYFAGHGIALDGDDGPAGYIVPQGANREDKASFLAMTDLNCWLDRLPCRHLLLVLDCCFAGAYRWSSTRDLGTMPDVIHRERFDRYIKDPAWQVITSAAYDQKALDVLAGEILGSRGAEHGTDGHSPFALAFLRALEKGEADLIPRARPGKQAGDGVITATELYLYLRECVEVGAEAEGHLQTPGLWPLKKHDKGEYIHLVPGHALNLPPAPALDEVNNPWRGLQSYDEEHAHVFFGRSRFVTALAGRVRAQPLTVVLGASGTGKSSVVKAGLVPLLRTTELDAWRILPPIRPGKSPLASLAGLSLPGEPSDDLSTHLAEFRIDADALAKRVGTWAEREPRGGLLLLVIDQFEELITLCWDPAERDHLMELLRRALAAHPARLRVVLTIRSDFEPQFTRSPLEADWMASRVVVPAMTLDEYRETIEGPASVKVLYFQGKSTSQEFINRLIGDVANTPGALPLLSFTLSELYRRYLQRGGDDRALREEDYEALGGVGGSLRNRAEEVFTGFPDDATRETMRRVMVRMISFEAGEVARRHVPDTELIYREPAENARVAEVLRRLTEARLVVEGKETDDEPYVEPAHDELVRGWDRLLLWIRNDAEGLQLRRRLTPAANAWGQTHGGLWLFEPRLGMLHKILDSPSNWLNAVETQFVRWSWFWRRAGQGVVVATILVLTGITWYARREQIRAVNGETAALKRERIANAQRLAANSVQALSEEPQRSLILAVEAIRATRDADEAAVPAAIQALNDALPDVQSVPLIGHQDAVTSIAVSRDDRLATASLDGTVRVWDLRDPNAPAIVVMDDDRFVARLAFAPDGRLAMAVRDQKVRVWDPKKPKAPPLILDGHDLNGSLLTFAPDNRLITAGGDRTVQIWDLNQPKAPPIVLSGHEDQIEVMAISPDGLLATGGLDRTVRVWNLNSPTAAPLVLRAHLDKIRSLCFGPDDRLVSGSFDRTAAVWNLKNVEAPPIVLRGPAAAIDHVAFSSDGRVITASEDRSVAVWPLKDPLVPEVFRDHAGDINALVVTPDDRIITAGADRTVCVRDLRNLLIPVRVMRGHERSISSLAIAPDGRLVSGGWDRTARVWNLQSGDAQPAVFRGHTDGIITHAIIPGGKLVTAGNDKSARVWDVSRPYAPPVVLRGHEFVIVTLAILPDGRLATGSWDRTVRLWDLKEPNVEPLILRGHEAPINHMVCLPDGRLATASSDRTVRLWDPKSPVAAPVVLRGHESAVGALAVAPDDRLVSYGQDHTPLVWDLKKPGSPPVVLESRKDGGADPSSDKSHMLPLPDQATFLNYTEGNERVEVVRLAIPIVEKSGRMVTGSVSGAARVWDLNHPDAPPLILKGHESTILHMAIAADGRLVTGAADETARVWNMNAPNAPPLVLRGHAGGICALAIAPDGLLVTASGDRTARVWDIQHPENPPLVLRGHTHVITALAFAPDGRLITSSMDDTARIWSFHLDELARKAARVASRNLSIREWEQFFGRTPYRRTFPDKPAGVPEGRLQFIAPRILDWVSPGGSVYLDVGGAVVKGQRVE